MSLSELKTLHNFCEFERTQILQSLTSAVLKLPYGGYLLSGNRSNFINYEGNILWYYTFLKTNDVKEESQCSTKKSTFCRHSFQTKFFWDTAVSYGSENSHSVEQINPNEHNYYLLTLYSTPMPSLNKFPPESIRAIARNPNIDLQSIGIYSRSDIQHHN